jgi:hypothetical protein
MERGWGCGRKEEFLEGMRCLKLRPSLTPCLLPPHPQFRAFKSCGLKMA